MLVPGFELEGCSAVLLAAEDAPELQRLWERCTDFHELQEGRPTRPTVAEEELAALPPGKTLADKLSIGIRSPGGELVGHLDLIRDYPKEREWWLGLLMLDPAARARGLGSRVYRAVAAWVAARGAESVCLAALEHNPGAERFWRRQGFEELRRQPFTSDTGHESRVIVMRHVLPPAPG